MAAADQDRGSLTGQRTAASLATLRLSTTYLPRKSNLRSPCMTALSRQQVQDLIAE
jgi:hypothetical protein